MPGSLPRTLVPTPLGGHRPQLDSLRALSALAVFFSHFWIEESYAGSMGVRVFFVLSGYLITGILLDIADRASRPAEAWRGIGAFFARRALRILPVFYAVLFASAAIDMQGIRDSFWWHALFASNVYFTYHGWTPDFAASWWTLGVEEQFYLVWPLIVLFLPRRLLGPLLGGMIAVSCARHLTQDVGSLPLWWRSSLMPIAQLDVLASGGLLALAARRDGRFPAWMPGLALAGGIASAVVVVLDATDWLIMASTPLLVAVVAACASGLRGIPGRILDSRALRAVGQLSYGAYVVHLAVAPLAARLGDWAGIPIGRGPMLFAVGTAISLAVAAVLWIAIERPFLALKRFVPYDRAPASPPASASPLPVA